MYNQVFSTFSREVEPFIILRTQKDIQSIQQGRNPYGVWLPDEHDFKRKDMRRPMANMLEALRHKASGCFLVLVHDFRKNVCMDKPMQAGNGPLHTFSKEKVYTSKIREALRRKASRISAG